MDFCSWSFARCPAELDVLVLSGHGLAFQDNRTGSYLGRGAVSHMPMFRTNKKLFGNLSAGFSRAVLVDQDDFVSVPELKGALGQIANLRQDSSIGVVVFDACLMSNVELLYEIHEFADTAVGSVDELSGAGLDLSGAATIATNRLRRGEEMDSEKMAAAFSDSFSPAWTTDSCVAVSLDTKQQQSLLVAFQKFVIALSALDLAERQTNSKIRIALSDGSRRLSRYQSKSLSDIAAFCSAFMSEDFPKKVRNAAKRFLSASESIVLNAKLGSDYERALGISIFSPSSFAEFRKDRLDYSGLSFAKKTGWLKFLEAVYADEIYETV
ncbi:MAG: clostripain-related cysteine peptidase [Parasphingorhabdus sp.]